MPYIVAKGRFHSFTVSQLKIKGVPPQKRDRYTLLYLYNYKYILIYINIY